MEKTPVRYCAARSDATIKGMCRKIEKVFKLPKKLNMIYFPRGKKLCRSKQLKISKINTDFFKK